MVDIILGKDKTNDLKINPKKTIFWTGAGISCIKPSSLPLGNGLTDAYLRTALGPKWKDFVVLWNNNFPQIRDAIVDGKLKMPAPIGNYTTAEVESGKAWERPRLEYIIGEMDKLDKYFNAIQFNKRENQRLFHRRNVLNALSNFSSVEPCIYHYRLADLAKAGSIIVTANFDDSIEKAIGIDSKKVETQYGIKAVRISDPIRNGNDTFSYVYHFHGISTDTPDNLGATIGRMSKGIDDRFQKYLCNCFEDGYSIVFIGYGGVDFFDVEPFFKNLKAGSYSGKAIYLDFCNTIENAERKVLEAKKYRYLLDAFQNQYIVYGDTETFFDCIYDGYSSVVISPDDCGAFNRTQNELKTVVDEQVDKDLYYFINTLRLCSQLNINPGRFYDDWVDRIKKLIHIWESDGKDTLKNMTVVNGQMNDGIIDDIYSNNWHDTELSAVGINKKLKDYVHNWNKKHITFLQALNRMCFGYGFPFFLTPKSVIRKYVTMTKDILTNQKEDEASIDLSRGTIMYLCGWQTKSVIFLYQMSRGLFRNRMLFLKECIDELLELPFTRFRYRTHYLSLCRQSAYIESSLHRGRNGYEGDIQKEWDICMQTPILFDAGQMLQARLIQAKWHGYIEGVEQMKEIRARIYDLRRSESKYNVNNMSTNAQ